eukprot:comp12166_c0_seq1/m.6918 comp12166_c0_seq1/g.6918  ORF comp12166_c0_seq1/g.6918 comp12166_c0_seq1/m.6918 type:complete len:335 (-) comp12166_c0_seq1:718-1722(-)
MVVATMLVAPSLHPDLGKNFEAQMLRKCSLSLDSLWVADVKGDPVVQTENTHNEITETIVLSEPDQVASPSQENEQLTSTDNQKKDEVEIAASKLSLTRCHSAERFDDLQKVGIFGKRQRRVSIPDYDTVMTLLKGGAADEDVHMQQPSGGLLAPGSVVTKLISVVVDEDGPQHLPPLMSPPVLHRPRFVLKPAPAKGILRDLVDDEIRKELKGVKLQWVEHVVFNEKVIDFSVMTPEEKSLVQRRMRAKHCKKNVSKRCIAANRRFMQHYSTAGASSSNVASGQSQTAVSAPTVSSDPLSTIRLVATTASPKDCSGATVVARRPFFTVTEPSG